MPKPPSFLALCTGLLLAAGSSALLAQPDPGRGGPGQPQMRVPADVRFGAGRTESPRQERHEPRERHDYREREREPRWLDDRRQESRSGQFRVDHERVRVVIGAQRDYWRPAPALPPGIRNNLRRGKPLPPGLDRHWLDSRLERQLPRYYGHEWIRVGNDLLLISVSTRLINDVLYDIFN